MSPVNRNLHSKVRMTTKQDGKAMLLTKRRGVMLPFLVVLLIIINLVSFQTPVADAYPSHRTSIKTSSISSLHVSVSVALSSSVSTNADNGDGSLHVEAEASEGPTRRSRPNGSNTPKRIRPRIPVLQYHDDWVCVNKPAGMTVHRGKHTPRRDLVLSTLLKRQLARKVYPVHRLDHRTSGAILFAFDSETCGMLHKVLTSSNKCNFKDDNGNEDDDVNDASADVEHSDYMSYKTFEDRCAELGGVSDKQYVALLKGDWTRKFGNVETVTVDKPLKVKEVEKDAETCFRLLASIPGDASIEFHPGACSLVLCTPKTGRTHQIRRHARAMGFPVIGDSAHGDSRVNRWWRENRNLNRLFLHCLSLDLPPLSTVGEGKSNERIQCIAPLLPELVSVLENEDLADLWNVAKLRDDRLTRELVDERSGTFGRNYRKTKGNGEDPDTVSV